MTSPVSFAVSKTLDFEAQERYPQLNNCNLIFLCKEVSFESIFGHSAVGSAAYRQLFRGNEAAYTDAAGQ